MRIPTDMEVIDWVIGYIIQPLDILSNKIANCVIRIIGLD